jgi:serine/threonine protein kinase
MLVDRKSLSRLKIIDWGLARAINFRTTGRLSTELGTPSYVAPEVLNGRKDYDQQADMWSVGVITYELLVGYQPFPPWGGDMLDLIATGTYEFAPDDWKDISPSAMDFIRRLLVVDPHKRLTAADALKHPWIKLGAPIKNPALLHVHSRLGPRVQERQRRRSFINFSEEYKPRSERPTRSTSGRSSIFTRSMDPSSDSNLSRHGSDPVL